jgi:filamentous hemagglutinin family protein
METVRRFIKNWAVKEAVIYVMIWCMLFNVPLALATPAAPDVVSGTAGITVGNTTTVTMGSSRAIINWDSLDTSSSEILQFVRGGGADFAVLNRVISGGATQFNGKLFGNQGNIFVVNKNGLVFGPTAFIQARTFVASALDIGNDDFINGVYKFMGGNGAIINQGTINADGVALIGKMVQNMGSIITASGGYVAMVAGDKVLLGEPGSNIIVETDSVASADTISVDGVGDVTAGNVINDGTITSPAGQVVLASGDIFSAALNLDSRAVKVIDGIGSVQQDGTINANGTTGDGGVISLTAGDSTILGSTSSTTANAGTSGNAGLVIAHSSGTTSIQSGAAIEAKGGHDPVFETAEPGQPVDTRGTVKASVEISGNVVNLSGSIDASAPISGGKRGKIVIDADSLTVADGAKPLNALANTIYEKWIESQSQTNTDLELVAHSAASGNITVNNITDGVITGGSGDIAFRTVYDTGAINFLSPDTTTLLTNGGGSIYMLAGSGGITTGDITTTVPSNDKVTDPGKIRLFTNNGGDITTGALTVNGGGYDEISAIAAGNLTIGGPVKVITNQVSSAEKEVGQAILCMVAGENINIDGDVTVNAHGKQQTNADIRVCAGKDATVNGDLYGEAKTSESGTSNTAKATIELHAGWNEDGAGTITTGKTDVKASISGSGSPLELTQVGEDSKDGIFVKIDINPDVAQACPDCPPPPALPTPQKPVKFSEHMNIIVTGSVFSDGQTLTVLRYSQPADGTVTVNSDGTFIYTPGAGFVGTDSFVYIAVDEHGNVTEPIRVTLTLTNELPVAEDGTATGHMNLALDGTVVFNDTPDAINGNAIDPLTVTYTQPSHGTVVFDEATKTFQYTPTDPGYVGQDSFTYTVSDGQQGAEPAQATVTLTLTNALPFANGTSVSGPANRPIGGDVIFGDRPDTLANNETDPLTVLIITQLEHGTVSFNYVTGKFEYTPNPGYVGQDTFQISVSDGQQGAEPAIATVTINVTSTPPPPPPPPPPVPPVPPAAPLSNVFTKITIDTGSCPALVAWLSGEVGTTPSQIQLKIASTFDYAPNINPCVSCATLKDSAAILTDNEKIAALARVVNDMVTTPGPITEEQQAVIAATLAEHAGDGTYYAQAGEWIDALVAYVGTLNKDLRYSPEQSLAFANKYYGPQLESNNPELAAYVAARVAELSSSMK